MNKQILGVTMLAVLTAFAAGAAHAADTYTIDPGHTYGHFEIGHMGLSTMQGRIDATGGTIVIDRDGRDSRVEVQFDPASVDTGHRVRDEHLRDMAGFFDVKKYPKMAFVSSSVELDADEPDEATVRGRLTMHGVTRPVTLEVEDMACRINPIEKSRYTCGFSAETELRRSDFGMTAYLPLVADEIDVSIEAEANRPVDQVENASSTPVPPA